MPSYVYCILSVHHDAPPAAVRGLDDQPVRAVHAGTVTIWVSDVAHAAPRPTVERVRAHDDVVRCALQRETPLPARFGQTFGSDAALVESAGARAATFVQALERVRGAVEMTVRLLPVRPDSARPPLSPVVTAGMSGREYLARLRDRHAAERARRDEADLLRRRIADEVRGLVRAEVRGLVRAEVRPAPSSFAHSSSVSHLVALEMVPAYRSAVRAVGDGATQRVVISGPWAPYSFAEIGHV